MNGEAAVLTEDDVAVLSKLNEDCRSACEWNLIRLRTWCDGKVGFSCTDIVPTTQGCVIYVLPAIQCSFAAFILLLERAVGAYATVWGSVPGRVEVAVEFEECKDWVATWEDFRTRDLWQAAIANKDSLPLALGIGMTGNDEILDLSTLAALFVYGGDTYAQGATLGNVMKTLLSARQRDSLSLYYLATDYVFPHDCNLDAINKAGKYECADSMKADDAMLAWSDRLHAVCAEISNEIGTRERLYDALDCNTLTEYNSKAKYALPRIVLVIVNPPQVMGEGAVYKSIDQMEDAVTDLFYKCGPKYGVHLIIADFLPLEPTGLRALAQYNMAGRNEDLRVGCLYHGCGGLMRGDESYAVSGGPELNRASAMTMLYRSPENELYKIHKLGVKVY